MANTVNKKYLTDENGNKFYPIGHVNAVYDNSGNILASRLSALSRTATIVIAASNSLNKAGADYICDGTADQATIQSAIDALPSGGGKVLLLEGTYNFSSSSEITIRRDNITLEGMGKSTILKKSSTRRGIFASKWSGEGQHRGLIIRNMVIDVEDGAENETNIHAISIQYYDDIEISNVEIRNILNANGIELYSVNRTHIHNCSFYNCRHCVYGWGNVHDSVFSDLIADTCTKHIWFTASCTLNVINSCYSRSCTVVGIQCEANYNTITGCGFYTCAKGIIVSGQRCVVQGNYIRSSSETGIYVGAAYCNVNGNITAESTDKSIYLAPSAANCLVGNNILDKAYTNDGGTSNEFVNNKS